MNWEVIKYPDGQVSVKVFDIDQEGTNVIRCRINSYEDLFVLKSIVEVLGYLKRTLFIPCLFGQRSDRRFSDNQSFDLKVTCDFINSCNFERVQIFDPHSDVSLALIDRSYKISSISYVNHAICEIGGNTGYLPKNLVLVSPDAGAYKKVFEYGNQLGLEVVAANKHRGLDGKVDLVFMGDVEGKECLIVDDLCDGGFTFYLLSKALRKNGASKVYLYVSHGLFSKGFHRRLDEADPDSTLYKSLDHIYCTNSIKDIGDLESNGYREKKINLTQFTII